MSQRQQLERIMEIDRQIRSGKFPNAEQLARDNEVSKRVIFNDRDFMIHRLGAPIKNDRERGGWFYTDETWVLPGAIVTEGELLVFFLSIEVARRYLGTSMEQTLRKAIEKFSQYLKGSISVELETLRSHYSFSSNALVIANEQALLDLHHAITESNSVWMRYYTASRDDHTERTIHPYHLANIRGDWYLIAYDELRRGFRNFSISRIEDLKILPDKFKRDSKFSVAKYMGTAFLAERSSESVEVAVRFTPGTSRYIRERHWHDSQQIDELSDGGLIIRFQTSGLGEVKRWVLQYGGEAEVLAPESLKKACLVEIEKMMKIYHL